MGMTMSAGAELSFYAFCRLCLSSCRVWRLFGLACAAGLTLSACSEKADELKTAQKIEACSLLQRSEVESQLGRSFAEPEPGVAIDGGPGAGVMSACDFVSAAPGRTGRGPESARNLMAAMKNAVYVNLLVWSWPEGSGGGKGYLHSFRSLADTDAEDGAAPPALRSVEGLGDEALWNGTLHVRQGDVSLSLSVRGHEGDLPGERDLAAEKALAVIALSRLP